MSRGRHAASRPVPWRAVMVALALLAASGIAGTWAYWTDTATVTSGAVESGSMDLQVGEALGGPFGAVGTGANHAATHIAVADLTPSESYAFPLVVRNVGDVDFTYGVTVTRGTVPTWTFVGDPITVRLFDGSPVASPTSYPVTESCGGTPLTGAPVSVAASSSSVVPPGRRLAGSKTGDAGTRSEQLCVLVSMLGSASNANQGQSGQLRFDFSADQVIP